MPEEALGADLKPCAEEAGGLQILQDERPFETAVLRDSAEETFFTMRQSAT